SGLQNRRHAFRHLIVPLFSWSAKYNVLPLASTSVVPTPGTLCTVTVVPPPAPGAAPLEPADPDPLAQPAAIIADAMAAAPMYFFHNTLTHLLGGPPGNTCGPVQRDSSRCEVVKKSLLRRDRQGDSGPGQLDRGDFGDRDRQRIAGDPVARGHGADALRGPLAVGGQHGHCVIAGLRHIAQRGPRPRRRAGVEEHVADHRAVGGGDLHRARILAARGADRLLVLRREASIRGAVPVRDGSTAHRGEHDHDRGRDEAYADPWPRPRPS